MATAIEVVFENGLLRPLQQLALNEGQRISILLIEPEEARLAAMREAMNDPLFLADLQEVMEDFQYIDAEGSTE